MTVETGGQVEEASHGGKYLKFSDLASNEIIFKSDIGVREIRTTAPDFSEIMGTEIRSCRSRHPLL